MKINNVADLFVETLRQAGVKRIYGLVGDSLNGITEAIRRSGSIDGCTCATKRSQPSPPVPRRN